MLSQKFWINRFLIVKCPYLVVINWSLFWMGTLCLVIIRLVDVFDRPFVICDEFETIWHLFRSTFCWKLNKAGPGFICTKLKPITSWAYNCTYLYGSKVRAVNFECQNLYLSSRIHAFKNWCKFCSKNSSHRGVAWGGCSVFQPAFGQNKFLSRFQPFLFI